MLELLLKGRACPACGAGVRRAGGGASVYDAARGGELVETRGACGLARAPRERSGLAHAAGFTGVLYLFHYSLAPLVFGQAGQEWMPAVVLMAFWRLLAPAALVLSFAAAASLDRSPRKAGRLPTLFGFTVGWLWAAAGFSVLDERWLASIIRF